MSAICIENRAPGAYEKQGKKVGDQISNGRRVKCESRFVVKTAIARAFLEREIASHPPKNKLQKQKHFQQNVALCILPTTSICQKNGDVKFICLECQTQGPN